MRLAIVCWEMVGQIGGIATHLNTLRKAAIEYGDKCDILYSAPEVSKKPHLFKHRTKIVGKDNWIWCDGLVPHHPKNVQDSVEFLQQNYDAMCYGFLCPTETKYYKEPYFLPLVTDVELPGVGWVMDGNFATYPDWVTSVVVNLDGILCPLKSYATPVHDSGIRVTISAFPFIPNEVANPDLPKADKPLMVWPNQWKSIKGVQKFVEQLDKLDEIGVDVELYSCGIDYWRMSKTRLWGYQIGEDRFSGRHGSGEAIYFGTVEHNQILEAFQRAHYTCNFQGMNARELTYRQGSYNNSEVEALYYGACPVLHSSVYNTDIPSEVYLAVDSAGQMPRVVKEAIKDNFALHPERQKRAREFVLDVHLASNRYLDMRNLLAPRVREK